MASHVFYVCINFILAYVILTDNGIEASRRKRTLHRDEYSRLELEARVIEANTGPQERVYSRVDVLAPGHQSYKPQKKVHFSTNVMDFNEDTSEYFHTHNSVEIRSSTPENKKFPVKDEGKKKKHNCKGKNTKRCREIRDGRKGRIRRGNHIKAYFYYDITGSQTNYLTQLKPPKKLPVVDPNIMSLHSPTKVFIPIWDNKTNEDDDTFDESTCVRCPVQMTLLAGRLEESVLLPVPPLSICSGLARMRGRLNLAVMSGPRPGNSLVEGVYPINLLAWKKQRVSSCRFTVTVKVLRCSEIEVASGVFMDCSKGTLWGSTCNFACIDKTENLEGVSATTCEQEIGNGVSWTVSTPPVCSKRKDIYEEKFECKQLTKPTNGMVICIGNPKNGFYKEGAVCQYVCLPGFPMISTYPKSKLPFPCRNGKWLPSFEVSCKQSHCDYPKTPQYGSVQCDADDGQKSQVDRGTICRFGCKRGYVIPASLRNLQTISCKGPQWNATAFPICRRSSPPVHGSRSCRNETFVVEQGGTFQLTSSLLPRFRSTDRFLTPVCTLFQKHRKLKRGVHLNQCQVSDLEIGKSAHCSYYIIIRERIAPEPYSKDCSNRTKFVTGDKIMVKNARFYAAADEHGHSKTLRSTCALSGKTLTVGEHINTCLAVDASLNISNSCTYLIIVRKRSCYKPRHVRNGIVKCKNANSDESFPPDTECQIVCNEGYFIPPAHKDRAKRKCQSNLKWSSTKNPHCMSKFRFKIEHPSECINKIVELKAPNSYTVPKPRYKSAIEGGKVSVQCSLTNPLPAGNHTNFCVAVDEVSGFQRSCVYDIVVVDSSASSAIPTQSSSRQTQSSSRQTQSSSSPTQSSSSLTQPSSSLTQPSSSPTLTTDSTVSDSSASSAIPTQSSSSPTQSSSSPTQSSSSPTQSSSSPTQSSSSPTQSSSSPTQSSSSPTQPSSSPTQPSSSPTQPSSSPTLRTDSTVSGKDCAELSAPVNGNISCNSSFCKVICAEGFDFSTLYPILRSGTITCDQELGLWDFQQDGLITHMPDCLRQVPPTSMEVTIKFLSGIKNCEDQDELTLIQSVIQEKLLETDGCDVINCHENFVFNCSHNPERQEAAILTEWTFSVPFKPSEYDDIPIVPDAETALKKVLRKSYADVQTDKFKEEFKKLGLDLWPDSYNRTTINLICDEDGFVPDDEFRCVHCSTETFETEGRCEPCPDNYYQNKTGQTECMECTDKDKDNPRCHGNNELIVPECLDQIVDEWNTTYQIPLFLTSRNTSAEVTCSALNSSIEVQTVLCNAIDLDTNAEAVCTFNVTIIVPGPRSSDVQLNLFEDPTILDDFPEVPWWRNT